ncbi:hypothetical protein [Leifsonia xyli]|uniref:hypothetical protein n=1 Tax=Leifsonia xyli TaxID=1575 RepID=UPI003D675571
MGRVIATAIVVSAVVLMSGCALLAPPPPAPTRTAAATTTPEPVPAAQLLPQLLVPGQTIGSGRLVPIEHEPIGDPRSDRPLTGAVRIIVSSAGQVEVRIRPDDPAAADLTGLDLLITGVRYDGRPENIQITQKFQLISALDSVEPDGELVLPIPGDFPGLGDPTFLHSVEESLAGDARIFAAASLTWTLPSPYPGLTVKDAGVATFAHGRTIVEDGVIATYIPNPYDTIYAVTRRFGITETQLLWLNPWMIATDRYLKDRVGINLDPARR